MSKVVLLLGILIVGAILFSCAPGLVKPVEKKPAELAVPVIKTGWEAEWEKTLQAAKKEGKVVIYASTGAAAARDMLIKNMREKYGVDVEMIVGRGNETSQKIFSERRAGLFLADAYIGGPTTIITVFIPAGIFDPIEKSLILPEVYDPKYWRGNKLHYLDKGRYVIRWAANVNQPLAINTSMVKIEEMTSFMDLLNSKFKGKIIMNDPSSAGNGQDFFYFVGVKIMGLDFMRQFLLTGSFHGKGSYPGALFRVIIA